MNGMGWGLGLFDCVVRGATLVDGTGLPRRRADIAIDGGRIVAMACIADRGVREVNADCLVAMPGIVDAHTHDDPLPTFDSVTLKAFFGSDIGHMDAPDFTRVVEETYELVGNEVLSGAEHRAFVADHAIKLHGGMNPDFFEATAIEDFAAKLLHA